jgi:hypothetical protein
MIQANLTAVSTHSGVSQRTPATATLHGDNESWSRRAGKAVFERLMVADKAGGQVWTVRQRCEAVFCGKPQHRSMPLRTSSSGASATQWRQVVATDASPWIVRKQRFSVPKGRQEILEQSLCRPFGTHRQCCCPSTGSHRG